MSGPSPCPCPPKLLPVAPLNLAHLPDGVAAFVEDASRRMPIAPDFIAIPAMVALGSVLGTKIAIRPKEFDNWQEVPNLWAITIGIPGIMKSAAVKSALAPLEALEDAARTANAKGKFDYEAALRAHEARKKRAEAEAKKGVITEDKFKIPEPGKPKYRRFIIQNATYEKLSVILQDNPNGILTYRDKIFGLLARWEREENLEERNFYLSG